jgi:hypothetical protein
MPSRKLCTVLPLLGVLAACSDDDDGGGGGPPLGQTEFAATLDRAQEVPAPITGTRVRVTVTNRAPDDGTFQTQVWGGFHDGTFDLFDAGSAASAALERLAEDGDPDPLLPDFAASGAGTTQGLIRGELGGPPGSLAPGETASRVFELDSSLPENRFFSYASMVIPSNDAFVANDGPTAIEIFDAGGNFVATDFTVAGGEVLDAGTEVNDELPANTAFFGQTTPDTGVPEGGVVLAHPGFLAPGMGGILDDPMFAGADFTAVGYEVLEFRFEELPAGPAPVGLATVELTSGDTLVEYTITASGLSGAANGVHFHEGAPGVAGPVVLNLTSTIELNADGEFRASGTMATPAGFADALRAGDIYVNIHTDLNPDGEIRGQVTLDEAFSAMLSSAAEVPTPIMGTGVRVTVQNRAPALGTFQTPVWIGFHDGSFDAFDSGAAASTALERLAEDGDGGPLMDEFVAQMGGTTQALLAGRLGPEPGPIAPGETVSRVFRLDPDAMQSSFLSYASMIIPSNDAFVSEDDPMAFQLFDVGGSFMSADFTVPGSAALDAGTEMNDELPANTAFFGQTTPDTGVDEGGVVTAHPGFLAVGMGGILDDPMFADADFTAPGYELLEVRLTEAPDADPATGVVVAMLDAGETEIDFTVVAHGLSGEVTGMHFHEGPPGVAGPIVIDLTDTIQVNEDGEMVASGTKAVSPDFVQALRDGDIYLNIHTALNPAGEIRGQIDLTD